MNRMAWYADIRLSERAGEIRKSVTLAVMEEKMVVLAPQEVDALLDALLALRFVEERYCPCGARAESPRTHPHVAECEIGDALQAAREARLLRSPADG